MRLARETAAPRVSGRIRAGGLRAGGGRADKNVRFGGRWVVWAAGTLGRENCRWNPAAGALNPWGLWPILAQVRTAAALSTEQAMSPKHLLRTGGLLLLPIALALALCLVTGCDNLQYPPGETELFYGVAISFG